MEPHPLDKIDKILREFDSSSVISYNI